MEFKEIASVKGKGGLFRVLKANESHIIVRPLDDTKVNIVTVPKHLLSMLDNVSIYTNSKDKTTPLRKVLQTIWKKFGDKLSVDTDNESLKAFMKSVLPQYDEERVYISDIKKLIRWYPTLLQHLPKSIKTTGTKANPEKKDIKKTSKKKVSNKQITVSSGNPKQKKKVTKKRDGQKKP